MIDIQHDSAVPVHEQITSQVRAHIASGALKPGAWLAEYRAHAQQLLTNPQVVARAYDELQREGVLKADAAGNMEITGAAVGICRQRLQESACQQLRQAVARGLAAGLVEAQIIQEVQRELADCQAKPPTPDQLRTAIKKSTHENSHRASQGIQDLSGQGSP